MPSLAEQAAWNDFLHTDTIEFNELNDCESIYCTPETQEDFITNNTFGTFHDAVYSTIYTTKLAYKIAAFACEADEVWSFVGNKANKQWIWLVMNTANRQIIGCHIGGHTKADANQLWESIPSVFRASALFCTDFLAAYNSIIPEEQHHAGGKDIGFVNHLERFNGTLRQRCSRLVRKTLSFSKSLTNHIGAIKYFICHYNLTCIIT